MTGPTASLRALNMRKRRARILAQARRLLGRGGRDALNLRALARAADVTVPTIYNLVGNKEMLVVALFSEALTEIETRIGTHRDAAPLEMAEAVVTESIGLFREDEDYYRAAFLAVEYLRQSPEHAGTVAQLYEWGERLTSAGCIACAHAGLLRGKIHAAVLGAQILRCYRTSCRAWAYRQTSIEAFHDTALTDVYISLAADAVETFHASLLRKIARLANVAPVPRSRTEHREPTS